MKQYWAALLPFQGILQYLTSLFRKDMEEPGTIHLRMEEGAAQNYYKALHKHFGGELKADSYVINNAETSIHMSSYFLVPQLELLVSEAFHVNSLDLERIPDEDPEYVHMNLIKEGQLTHSFKNTRVNVEADTARGAFIYNGLFPLTAHHPAGVPFKSVAFKLSRKSLGTILPEAVPVFDQLFGTREAMGYHAAIPTEIDRLSDDLFRYRAAEFGNRSMVIARGIEVLTSIFATVKKQSEKKQLNGLHADDYHRLQRIRKKIQSSLEGGITLEALADEFGISVSKLKRDFKALHGVSVYQFFTHSRMDEAYRRLKTGEYSVMEVGYDLGYSNLSKFSEMFKKVKGFSPKEIIP